MPSTPASYFHLLRHHAYARPRRPLIVFTPKSMLRLKAATSGVEEFTGGTFRPVIGDAQADPPSVTRVVFCSGKLYYDLVAERDLRADKATAVIRIEQLAPLPIAEILSEIAAYPDAELVWAQQEPANQGPWPHLALGLAEHLGERRLHRASRPASASPATGSSRRHEEEQRALVAQALRH